MPVKENRIQSLFAADLFPLIYTLIRVDFYVSPVMVNWQLLEVPEVNKPRRACLYFMPPKAVCYQSSFFSIEIER
jgi:hypothetical protein